MSSTFRDALLTRSRRRLDLALAGILVALYAAAVAGMKATALDMPAETWATFGLFLVPLACVSLCCRILRKRQAHAALDTLIAMAAVTLPLFILSYCAIRLDRPLVDDRLVGLDAALMFDWPSVLKAVDARPLVAHVFFFAYASLGAQLILLPIYFAAFRDPSRGGAMLVTYVSIVVISCVVAAITPSIGAYTVYHLTQSDLANVDGGGGLKHLADFGAIRTGERYLLTFEGVAGLITFPSVHAAAAVMCAWVSLGSRLLRWPLIPLNATMFIAAIPNGGHYLMDLIAGFAIAVISIGLARTVFPRATIGIALRDERHLYLALKGLIRRALAWRPGVPRPAPAASSL